MQMWRYQGSKTLAYYLRRRDCIAALAEDLGVQEEAVIATVFKQVLEGIAVSHVSFTAQSGHGEKHGTHPCVTSTADMSYAVCQSSNVRVQSQQYSGSHYTITAAAGSA